MRIRIVSRPPGEAPPEIRDAWIGTTLDVADGRTGTQRFRTMGILSLPRSRFRELIAVLLGRTSLATGYAVYADAALAQLEKRSPEAARWWRETVPHLVKPGRRFVFAETACEVDGAMPSNISLERMPGP